MGDKTNIFETGGYEMAVANWAVKTLCWTTGYIWPQRLHSEFWFSSSDLHDLFLSETANLGLSYAFKYTALS